MRFSGQSKFWTLTPPLTPSCFGRARLLNNIGSVLSSIFWFSNFSLPVYAHLPSSLEDLFSVYSSSLFDYAAPLRVVWIPERRLSLSITTVKARECRMISVNMGGSCGLPEWCGWRSLVVRVQLQERLSH